MPDNTGEQQNTAGGKIPPGGGYVPPGGAVAFNLLSGATGGAGVITTGFMTLAWSMDAAAVAPQESVGVGPLPDVPLAAALLLAAIVFAGLALLITALSGRNDKEGYVVKTPLVLLSTYTALTLLGLAAYGFGLDFLARRASASFHLAAMVGTLLEILAFAIGVYSLLPLFKGNLKTSEVPPSKPRQPVAGR